LVLSAIFNSQVHLAGSRYHIASSFQDITILRRHV